MDQELVVIQRLTQVGIQPEILKHALVHLGREDAELAPAVLFSGVHGGIGVTNDAFPVVTVLRGEGDAQGTAGVNFDQADSERLAQAG